LSKADAVAQGLDYYFDKEAAARPVRFFETFLHHSKGKWAGQPFKLLEWQKVDIVEELFGWLRVKDDLRRYRLAYIEVPKKTVSWPSQRGSCEGQDITANLHCCLESGCISWWQTASVEARFIRALPTVLRRLSATERLLSACDRVRTWRSDLR